MILYSKIVLNKTPFFHEEFVLVIYLLEFE